MPGHDKCSNLFVTVDRATCWVYVEHKSISQRGPRVTSPCVWSTRRSTIAQVLTDNGKEFTDRFRATGQAS